MTPKNTLLFTLLVLLPAIAFKWLQRDWGSDELLFLLYPVQLLVQLFTGLPAYYQVGEGYMFPGFIIEKSCAGVNFLVICWCSLGWLSLYNRHSRPVQVIALALCVPLSYCLCLAANTFRILGALLLQRLPGLHGPQVHEALGVVVYLSVLLLATTLFHYLLNLPNHAKLA